ncbi:hypothetical protein OG874_36435 [Nocardia sp. NBC_00565]|uniref:hypothetical protein n=1 Tax=Nocardia sp. NBC_00565 TaxID=2975993 RepID=UPI002E81A273|nr:hypothetical protein [Nocardia sp. NBC_00565]WUC02171.1 hypothetical protein OG874_36435 [Nocardia sp. NBC_00565]
MISGIDPDQWSQLLERANAGELSLSPEVGKDLDKVCDDHIDRLNTVLALTDNISRITGFGDFPSGKILEKKFSETASGTDRSLDAVVKQHIDAVETAKEVVAKAIANFVAQDQDRASQLTQVTPE